jgi:cytochrome c oxidase subunit 2
MVLIAAAGLLLMVPASPAGAETNDIKVTARKYEFEPSSIKVKKGDHVKLEVTATDRDHGIKVDAFHISQKLPKGEPVTIEFDATEAGTFPFECSVLCGLGHKRMKGEIVVE